MASVGELAAQIRTILSRLANVERQAQRPSPATGDLADHLADATDAHDATAISFSPASGIAATNVQAAIVEALADAAAAAAIAAVQPGTVVDWTLPTAPTNWAFCYGQALTAASQYRTALIAAGNPFGSSGGHPLAPDLRGRVTVGLDNMGGSDAGRLSVANTLGGTGGLDSVQLAISELPAHNHGGATGTSTVTFADLTSAGRDAFSTGLTVTAAATGITVATSKPNVTITDPGHLHATAASNFARRGALTGGGSALAAGTQVWSFAGNVDSNTTGITAALASTPVSTVTDPNHAHVTTAATLNAAGNLAHTHVVTGAALIAAQTAHSHVVGTQGGNAFHTNLQPYMLTNKIVFLGV